MSQESLLAQQETNLFLKRYTEVAIFLFGFLSTVVRSGYSYGAVLLFLGGLYVLVKYRSSLSLERTDRLILAVLLLFGVEGVLSWLWHGFDADVDKPIRAILAIPIFFLVLQARPSLKALWLGLATGVLASCILVLYQAWAMDIYRPGAHMSPIRFGNLLLMQGMFCLAGVGWALGLEKRADRVSYTVLLLLAALGGLVASAISGSRGAWVALPAVFVVVAIAYWRFIPNKIKWVSLVTAILAVVAIVSSPQLGVQQRAQEAVNDIVMYQEGQVATSVGLRFDSWKGAVLLIKEKPWLGWAQSGYEKASLQQGEQGVIHPAAAAFAHPHNEYLDVLVKRGLFGFIVLLILYCLPLVVFAQALRHHDWRIRSLALAGIVLPLSYLFFGISHPLVRSNSMIMVYAISLVVFMAYIRVQVKTLERVNY